MHIFARYALELAIIIPDAVFLYLPLIDDLRPRTWIIAGILLPLFVLGAALVSSVQMLPVIPMLVVSVLFLFFVFFFTVNITLGRKLFCFFTSIMLGAFCLLYSIVIMAASEAANDLWASTRLMTIESCFVSLALGGLIIAMFFRVLTKYLPMLLREERLAGMWDYLFLLPFGATVLIGWLTPIQPSLILMGRARIFVLLLLPLIPSTVLLIYYLLWWMAALFSESASLQQERTMLMVESKRYEELRIYMDETRTLRHDFRQHILVISQLSSSGKFAELQEYLAQFSTGAGRSCTGYCGNAAVDAVASYYAGIAEGQDTRIDWELNLPKELPLKESEYCAMLGNLLENALRAVKALPKERRYVKVISSLLSETIIGLSMDNPFAGRISFGKNGLPHSEREGHGIGLASVMNTVKRYEGSMEVKAKDGVFSVDIVLYCIR